MKSGNSQSNLFSLLDLIPSDSSGRTRTLAALASSETLRATLGLSRRESYWQLMHAPSRLVASLPCSLSPAAKDTQKSRVEFPKSGLTSPGNDPDGGQRKSQQRFFPTDKDYCSLLNHLQKFVNGSALSFRFITLSESKPAELILKPEERQYIHIKTKGLNSPMKVLIRRSKGKVVLYVSKRFQEPNEHNCEETHFRDDFTFSEPGLQLKTAWVYLGVHCLEEVILTISVSFGHRRRTQASIVNLPSLTGLGEFRQSDERRAVLSKHVDELLATKTEASKASTRDFIRENRASLRTDEARNAFNRLKVQRREEVLRKYFQNKKEKKKRALLFLHRQELRIEANDKARLELEARQQKEAALKQWLRLLSFSVSTEAMHANYAQRKASMENAGRQLEAAIVLQRCCKYLLLRIRPKKNIFRRVIHHLAIFSGVIGPEIAYESRNRVANLIKSSAEASRVKDSLSAYYRKSKL